MVVQPSNSHPVVSVVIAAFNGERYIGDAVESALNQTVSNLEVIVIDDGSTDRTAQILSEIRDPRLRVIHHDHNLGITKTRNDAISAARGEYIAVLDCDDLAKSNRIADQLQFLKANPDYAMVATCADFIDEEGSYLAKWDVSPSPDQVPAMLIFQNFIVHSSVMLRASMLPEPVYRDFEPSEDYDLWVRLSEQHKMAVLARSLVQYRVHEQNISSTGRQKQKAASVQIIRRQLERLGLTLDEHDISLHLRMYWAADSHDRETLVSIRRWLETIRTANRESFAFEPRAMDEVLQFQWLKACKRACKRSPRLLGFCLFSGNARGYRLAFLREIFRTLGNRLSVDLD